FLYSAFVLNGMLSGSSTQITVPSPMIVKVEDDVTLPVRITGSFSFLKWYRELQGTDVNDMIAAIDAAGIVGLGTQYTGQEELLGNNSLLIQNVLTNYTSSYTVEIQTSDFRNNIELGPYYLGELLQNTTISFNNSSPIKENGTVVMTYCVTGTVDKILWYKDNELLHASVNNRSISDIDRIQLSSGNKTLTISNVSRTDSGIYQCVAHNPIRISSSDEITLKVFYGSDIPTV
uniref:Ig-like domain-containing protein n=1 Tax=Latimeria chalumnae TaxID=7897 RepID=H3A7X3_LATCH